MSAVFFLQTHILKAIFPYSENRRNQIFIILQTWVLVCYFISAQCEGNGLASEFLHGVKTDIPKKTLVCLSRFGLGLGTKFLAVSIGLSWFSRRAFSKISALEGTCALHRRHRTPQVSSHSPHILRYHRAPERASHATKSSYSEREIDFTCFFVSLTCGVLFLVLYPLRLLLLLKSVLPNHNPPWNHSGTHWSPSHSDSLTHSLESLTHTIAHSLTANSGSHSELTDCHSHSHEHAHSHSHSHSESHSCSHPHSQAQGQVWVTHSDFLTHSEPPLSLSLSL